MTCLKDYVKNSNIWVLQGLSANYEEAANWFICIYRYRLVGECGYFCSTMVCLVITLIVMQLLFSPTVYPPME